MPSFRKNRVNEDVKRELSEIFRTIKDPRVPELLSIVKCDVSGDLSVAKIYVSAIEGEEATKNAVKGLASAAGYVRRELSARLKLRKTPELKFIADNSIEHGIHIAKMLEDMEK